MDAHFQKNFSSNLGELTSAASEIGCFLEKCGIGGKAAYTVCLAFEEMATNIIKYGFDDNAEHSIDVSLDTDDKTVTMTLSDDGHAFNPLDSDTPDVSADISQRSEGGLGIHLVREMADSCSYERIGDINVFRISVRMTPDGIKNRS